MKLTRNDNGVITDIPYRNVEMATYNADTTDLTIWLNSGRRIVITNVSLEVAREMRACYDANTPYTIIG